MKIIILGMINSDNLGDPIIYMCLKKILEDKGHSVAGMDFEGDGEKTKPQRKRKPLSGTNSKKLIGSVPTLACWINNCRWAFRSRKLRHRIQAGMTEGDALLIGGGQLLSDIFNGLPNRYVDIVHALQQSRIPYAIAFCGADRTYSRRGRAIYTRLLTGAKDVVVRGDQSLKSLKALTPISKLTASPDPAFATSKVFPRQIKKRSNTIGICFQSVRDLAMHSSFFRMHQERAQYSIAVSAIDQFLAAGKVVEIFTNGTEEDYDSASTFLKSLPKRQGIALAARPTDPMRLIDQIASYTGVVSFRMHAAIVAYSFRVPSLNIVWDPKIVEVWNCISSPQNYIHPEAICDATFCWERQLENATPSALQLEASIARIESTVDELVARLEP